MGPKRRKRIKKNGIAEEKSHLSDFIWLKIRGVGVFWPVQVMACSNEDELEVFCKSDDADLEVYRLRMTGASENVVFAGDLTPFERKLMETQEVFTTRGKGHRGVPILIPEYAKAGMEFIANRQVRTMAGVVDNTYLFAIPATIYSFFQCKKEQIT